ncbi:MAG: hypothetical protein AAFQ45_10515 [Pseudomonadota bacterium]
MSLQRLTSRIGGALIAGILLTGGAMTAAAADLSGDYYGDRRYADMFGNSDHDGYAYDDRRERYAERRQTYPDPAIDDDDGYAHRKPRKRYREYSRYEGECLRRGQIISKLVRSGWSAFTPVRLRRRVAVIEADNSNGDRYRLRVDRCDGHIRRKIAIHGRDRDRGYSGYERRRRYSRYYD